MIAPDVAVLDAPEDKLRLPLLPRVADAETTVMVPVSVVPEDPLAIKTFPPKPEALLPTARAMEPAVLWAAPVIKVRLPDVAEFDAPVRMIVLPLLAPTESALLILTDPVLPALELEAPETISTAPPLVVPKPAARDRAPPMPASA
jgi:hypothetical protein